MIIIWSSWYQHHAADLNNDNTGTVSVFVISQIAGRRRPETSVLCYLFALCIHYSALAHVVAKIFFGIRYWIRIQNHRLAVTPIMADRRSRRPSEPERNSAVSR